VNYIEFKGWVDSEESKLIVPADWKVLAPPACINPSYLEWVFRWSFHLTSDNKYIRIWERYDKIPKMVAMTRRIAFAFHYGPLVRFEGGGGPAIDALGTPRYEAADPVDIRIDTCSKGMEAHLHYQKQNPHYSQTQVSGLDLSTLDIFTFLRAIIKHRANGIPLDRVLGFRIP
jgi:hypothetical protein